MNPNFLPIMENIRQLPVQDQLELISEISRTLSRSYSGSRFMTEKTASEEYREWLDKVIRMNPAETPAYVLDKRIKQERDAWD
ncbi:MAG: hypothetical protein R2941_17635 [Desulfobacterales bacterium]